MDNISLKDKMPPNHDEAERAVIGAVLRDPDILTEVLKILKPDDFYRNSHILVFTALVEIADTTKKADIITLVDFLRSKGELEQAGGTAYISSLTDAVPTVSNVDYYAGLVKDASVRRTIIKVSSQMISECYDETMETKELIESAEKRIFQIAEKQRSGDIKTVKDIIPGTIDKIEKLIHNKESMTGIPSGISKLDSMTNGFQKSDFIIVGARPSIGKTALATSIASNIAVKKKIAVGFFTLEMPAESLFERILAGEARVDFQKIRNGLLAPADLRKLVEAAGRIYEAPFYTDDTPNASLLDLKAQARRMKMKYDIKIMFIDYIGLIRAEMRGNIPRHEQVGEISRQLKSLARELEIPVVCLSQVGRQTEGKEPTLADLRESGSIEQDADMVMFLHRERDNGDDPDNEFIETDLNIAKHRNGPTGRVPLAFVKRFTRYEAVAHED